MSPRNPEAEALAALDALSAQPAQGEPEERLSRADVQRLARAELRRMLVQGDEAVMEALEEMAPRSAGWNVFTGTFQRIEIPGGTGDGEVPIWNLATRRYVARQGLSQGVFLTAGRYCLPGWSAAVSLAATWAAGELTYSPFYIGRQLTFDPIGVSVSIAGGA